MLNRFLGALKSQLEGTWNHERKVKSNSVVPASIEKPYEGSIRGHARQWSRALRPQPVRLENPEGRETEPLSPTVAPQDAEEGTVAKAGTRAGQFWVPNAPWSIKRDGVSAMLEFSRALIGYILYGARTMRP
jgi:hypothetical protein